MSGNPTTGCAGVAASATAVHIAHVAAHTQRIRPGSGGVTGAVRRPARLGDGRLDDHLGAGRAGIEPPLLEECDCGSHEDLARDALAVVEVADEDELCEVGRIHPDEPDSHHTPVRPDELGWGVHLALAGVECAVVRGNPVEG
jgi:hypothetical protein